MKIFIFLFLVASILLGDIKLGYVPGGTNDFIVTSYKGEILSEYFNKKIKENVVIIKYSSYNSLKSAIISKNVDIAIIANYKYREFIKNANPLANASKTGKKLASYMLIVNKSSGINNVSDLEGKVLACSGKMGSVSFLSSVVKKNPENIFSKIVKNRTPSKLIGKVASKEADLTCVNEGVYNSIIKYRPNYKNRLKVFYKSKQYASDLLIASKKLSSAKFNKIKSLLLGMRNDPEGGQVLVSLKVARFISPIIGEDKYPVLRLYKKDVVKKETKDTKKVAKKKTEKKTKKKTAKKKTKKDDSINLVKEDTTDDTIVAEVIEEAENAKKEAKNAKREAELAKKEAELAKKEMLLTKKEAKKNSLDNTKKKTVVLEKKEKSSLILYIILALFFIMSIIVIFIIKDMKKQKKKTDIIKGQNDLVDFYGDSGISQLFNVDMPDTAMMGGTVVGTVVRIALSGRLEDTHVAKIFKKLIDDEKTGILTLTMGPQVVDIHFKDGKIVTAFCKTGPFQTKLKNNLIKEVPDSKEKIELLFNESVNNQEVFCSLLRKEKVLQDDKLDSLASVQAKEIILSIFLWTQGVYQFNEFIEDDLDFEEEVKLQFDIMALVQEGINRYNEWKYISKSISKATNRVFFTDKDKLYKSNPNKNLLEIVELIDETRTIKDICDLSRFSDFKILKLLARLKEKGYVNFGE